MPGSFVINRSSQWSKNDADESMMLHADMIMFKNFTTSGQFDTPSCEFDDCPLSDTAHHVSSCSGCYYLTRHRILGAEKV